VPLSLTRGERMQAGERSGQFAGRRAKRPGYRTDFAEHQEGQQPAPFQPTQNRVVQAVVTELVTDDEVDGRALGQAVVEVGDVEAATFLDTGAPGEVPRLSHGDRRDVESADLKPAPGEPHGDPALPAGQIEGIPRNRQQVRVLRQDVRWHRRGQGRRSLARVSLIPPTPIDLRHSRHPRAATDRRDAPPDGPPGVFCDKIAAVILRAVVGTAMAAVSVLLGAPVAPADACPNVEVVFARGTAEPPGVGRVGDNFVDALRAHIGGKSLGVYPVNYPANTDFPTAVDGVTDAGAHVERMAAVCPMTRMVLGGYSQGAAVIGFVTANAVPEGVQLAQVVQPMPSEVANHVAAVALFGKPSSRFMSIINEPPVTVGPLYAPKTIELCVPGDAICAGGTIDPTAHRQYVESGMVDQAADFTAKHL